MPEIKILMATCNGAAYLQPQLSSLLDQEHRDWELWVSDDASTDQTRDQLTTFDRAHPGRVAAVVDGPRQGSAANFLSLLNRPEMAGSWVAFADQDDVWMPHKLSAAVAQLVPFEGQAAVYASRSVLTKAELTELRPSKTFERPMTLHNAVLQNLLGGNTIVMTPQMTDVLRATVPVARAHDVPFHDWWVYLMATASGAAIINDTRPGVYYRQHETNLMGAGAVRRLDRVKALMQGAYANWIDRNVAALADVQPHLTPEAQQLIAQCVAWRGSVKRHVINPSNLGLYRQTPMEDRLVRLLARLGRL